MRTDADEPRAGAGIRGPALAFVLLFALWCASFNAYRPGPALRADAPASQFSAMRALAELDLLLPESIAHPMGSAANQVVRERILARLRQLGYQPELQSGVFGCDRYAVCGTPVNIVARLGTAPGAAHSGVLLATHYDSVPAGPGASDDGAGVAEALEIARVLKFEPPPTHPIVLLITDGEELGLLGAQVFVEHHAWAGSIKAAVNIDNRGTSGPALMFETGSANAWLMRIYARHVSHPLTNSIYYSVYKQLPNNTDFTVYKEAGWQGFNFAFIGDVAHYHTPGDDLAHADPRSVQQQGDDALEALWALANSDLDHPTAGEAVYFDVFGLMLVRLPLALVLPACAATLIVVLLATAMCARGASRMRGFARELCWALAGLLTAWIFAALLAQALLWALRTLAPSGLPQHAPLAWIPNVLFAAVGTLAVALLSIALRGRVSSSSFCCANLLLVSALALLAAAKLPGASYLLLLPAIVGVLALFCGLREAAALLYLTVMFSLLWAPLMPLYDALGSTACTLIAVLIALGATPLAGLLLESSLRADRWLAGCAIAVVLMGAGAALALPAHTVGSPAGLNIGYWIDHSTVGTARARWLVAQRASSLPNDMQRHAPFERVRPQPHNPLLDFGNAEWFAAPAPLEDLPAPQFQILSAVTTRGVIPSAGAEPPPTPPAPRRHYITRIASPRGAAILAVAFPATSALDAVTVRPAGSDAAAAVSLTPARREHDWQVMSFANPPPQGIELSFDASSAPFIIQVLDRSYGLPSEGRLLQADRPPATTPIQDGDITLITTEARVAPP